MEVAAQLGIEVTRGWVEADQAALLQYNLFHVLVLWMQLFFRILVS